MRLALYVGFQAGPDVPASGGGRPRALRRADGLVIGLNRLVSALSEHLRRRDSSRMDPAPQSESAMSLMPCFQPNQAFSEGVILGRLLAGYGELELTMCACLIVPKRIPVSG
jgi:hypothetical protein